MLDPYADKLNALIISVYDSVNQVEEKMLSQTLPDVSIGELHILETIWNFEDHQCSVSDIAQARQVTVPSMTIAIKKLEKKGYVQKARSSQDGRVVRVTLTRMGRKVNAMHRYFHEQMIRSFLKGVSEEQKPGLMEAIQNLENFLQRQLQKIQPQHE